MKRIEDYQATMVKRERVGGKLRDLEYAFIKVRHEPFSVYMYFLGPTKTRGRQMMYVEGRNDGKMLIHEGHGHGCRVAVWITPSLPHPITTVGIKNLAAAFAKRGPGETKSCLTRAR